MTLLGSVFLFSEPEVVHAAGTPCSITPVLTEANLNTCIAEAPTDNSEFTITLGASFNLTTTKSIAAGRNITLISANPASPATLTRDSGFAGRLFSVSANLPNIATLTIDSVIIDSNNQTFAANNQLIYTVGTGDVTVNLSGNTVLKNNNSTSNGGTILIYAASNKLNIAGNAQIISNTTTGTGNIYTYGVVTMSGGTVTGNTANHGGGFLINNGGTLNMTGGAISDNTAERGGGIYMPNGTLNMTNSQVSSNTATNAGGGIYIAAGTLNLYGGATISDNIATNVGGGIRVQYGTEANMYAGAAITGNTAANYCGGASILGTLNMYGGEISGNDAENSGGGVCLHGTAAVAKLNMPIGSTGIISNNTAKTDGGGVWITQAIENTLDMLGGTISDNTAENGGGVWLDVGTANIAGGNVTGNIATLDGGGVFTEDYDNLFVGASAVFSGNRAASSSPVRNPADDAIYAANILGTNWTTPFTQGYNNYDINHDHAPNAPGTGLFGDQISSAAISALSATASAAAIIAVFAARKLLAKRH